MMEIWDRVARLPLFSSLDRHFARLLKDHASGEEAQLLALSGALLSRERRRGHSCLDLRDLAPRLGAEGVEEIPDPGYWASVLRESSLVSDGNGTTPLVLDDAGRLYLHRYWSAERRLAGQLRTRLDGDALETEIDPDRFARLFGPLDPDGVDWQAVSAVAALRRRFTVITGGPGTGKTSTVIKILALLLGGDETLHVALAAPTGKAAARLTESITRQRETLPVDEAIRERIPTRVRTIHRLLRYRPRDGRFVHDAANPLACDALIVDEASMVDLLLMEALVEATPPRARIVLLGDADQLASVEAGFVLGDICRAAGPATNFSAELAAAHQAVAGQTLPSVDDGSRLADSVVELQVGYRFQDHPGLARIGRAIRQGDASQVVEILQDPELPDARWTTRRTTAAEAIAPLIPALESYLEASSPEEALSRFSLARIVCALRRGEWGVEGFNAAVESWLARKGHAVHRAFYAFRPILIVSNDYSVNLFNGDVGICWPEEETGQLAVYFQGESGELRAFSPARLPDHTTAWAMTVHKSQGSEFDEVLLVLPELDHALGVRELVYTGVTRARKRLHLVADEDALRQALGRETVRASGLTDAFETSQPIPVEHEPVEAEPGEVETVSEPPREEPTPEESRSTRREPPRDDPPPPALEQADLPF